VNHRASSRWRRSKKTRKERNKRRVLSKRRKKTPHRMCSNCQSKRGDKDGELNVPRQGACGSGALVNKNIRGGRSMRTRKRRGKEALIQASPVGCTYLTGKSPVRREDPLRRTQNPFDDRAGVRGMGGYGDPP